MRIASLVLAGTSLLALIHAPEALARDSATVSAEASAETGDSAEDKDPIIVTARRREELLKDVPQMVTVVTNKEIADYQVRNLSDLNQIISGFQLETGFGAAASTRGVTFSNSSAAFQPTVGMYFNDAPTQGLVLFQSMYDVGQFEFLRGPQGTLRGIANPSGAMTITARRPDLNVVGGYLSGAITNNRGRHLEGAVTLPFIPGVLAVRAAGLIDDNDGNGIYSVNKSAAPNVSNWSGRVTVLFQPTPDITLNVMYQHLRQDGESYGGAVFGPGTPGGGSTNQPANYSGRAIGQYADMNAADGFQKNWNNLNLVTGQLDWTFSGQKLSYVGSYTDYAQAVVGGTSGPVNTLPGYVSPSVQMSPFKINSHELRLSSVDRVAGIFDYVVGAFYSHEKVNSTFTGSSITTGFFGPSSASANPSVFNYRYTVASFRNNPRDVREISFFGNLTAHIGEKLEISAGLRHINSHVDRFAKAGAIGGFSGSSSLPQSTCTSIGGLWAATYPNFCDIPVGPSTAFDTTYKPRHNAVIYMAQASYKVTPDLLVYASMGSSWREGPLSIGIDNYANDPVLSGLQFLSPEKSRSYELGAKWSFWEGRGHLFLAYYHQVYDGLIYSSPFNINYYGANPNSSTKVGAYPFNSNVNAKIDGIDVDFSLQPIEQWSVSGNFSWANGKVANSLLPCNDSNFDGIPDTGVPPVNGSTFIAAGKSVAFCALSPATSKAPRWNASIQSEFHAPIAQGIDAYIRGNFTYQPKNPNANQAYTIPAYGLLNLYLGLRNPDRQWEVSAYAKNITKTRTILAIGSSPTLPFSAGSTGPLFGTQSGYTDITLAPRREFGLSFRYAFGSR